jgi:hypothetical protein
MGEMNKYQVKLETHMLGEDLLVVLTGGQRPHCGAVALAVPYKQTASCSLLSMPQHKDGDLAKPLDERIAKRTGKNVVLVAGLHVDNATPDDIQMLVDNSEKEVERFLEGFP